LGGGLRAAPHLAGLNNLTDSKMAEELIYVRFNRPTPGFAYFAGQEDWVRKEKATPFIASGHLSIVEVPQIEIKEFEPRQVKYQRRNKPA
jgi:hypothetical protein